MVVDLHVWKVHAMNVIKYIHMYFMNDHFMYSKFH